ncbi:hypothetical protein F5146DRAFT_672536 [Armillaria mellea]|nr:hypothetical protein F5146DRAFT_672536 [Armillaria mellea]
MTMTMTMTNPRRSVQILFTLETHWIRNYMSGGISTRSPGTGWNFCSPIAVYGSYDFYASKHSIAFVFNVAGRCCSTRLVYVCCHFNLPVQALSHGFIQRFANDPMGSMNCRPTAQSDATQQAMIDCRKGLTGEKRDLSIRMYIEGTCSSKEDYDKYYQQAYDKAKESCNHGQDPDSDDGDTQSDSDDSTNAGDSGDSWF